MVVNIAVSSVLAFFMVSSDVFSSFVNAAISVIRGFS